MSKASEKAIAKDALKRRVEAALMEAYAEAESAYREFERTAPRTPEGLILDTYGYATVLIYKPSYRFRTALTAINEIKSDNQGGWTVESFTRMIKSQSITANERACFAARDVLRRHFPDEPPFFVERRRD